MHPVATARGSVTKHSVVRFADSIENLNCDPTDEESVSEPRAVATGSSSFAELLDPIATAPGSDTSFDTLSKSLGCFRSSAARTFTRRIVTGTILAVALTNFTTCAIFAQTKPDKDYLVYVVSESADKIALVRFGPNGARVDHQFETGDMRSRRREIRR